MSILNFLIAPAYAQGGASGASASPGGSLVPTIIMVGLFFVFMYFMIIRPQMKRQKEHKQLLESLEKGNEVVTQGGIGGRIRDVGEHFVIVEIANDVQVKVQKSSISSVVPKGTIESM